MAYRDNPDYDRERLYDDHDAYGSATAYERGLKRPRSPSPYDHYRVTASGYDDEDAHRGSSWDAKRPRERDDLGRAEYGVSGVASAAEENGYSPRGGQGPRRTWDELDPEEKEREWARYDREMEWERYNAERDAEAYGTGYDDRYGRRDYDRAREPEYWTAHAKAPRLSDPMDSPTILPFRRYAQLLRELGTEPSALASGPEATQQLYDKYQEYRTAFNRRMMYQFWDAHKDEKWFKEKYGISEEQVEARRQRRKAGRQGRKGEWLQELRSGKLDKIDWDAHEAPDVGTSANGVLLISSRLGEQETLETQDVIEVPPEPNQILLRQIPVETGRDDLENVLAAEEGFQYLALGEAHPAKRLTRMGWATFAPREAAELQAVVDRLNQATIEGQKLTAELPSRPAQAKLKVAPEYASTLQRLAIDFVQAQELLGSLETEDRNELWKDETAPEAIGIDAADAIDDRLQSLNLPCSSGDEREWVNTLAKGEKEAAAAILSGMDEDSKRKHADALKKALDLYIDLFRQVYHCDYYSSTLCDFPEELKRRSPRVVRRTCSNLSQDANSSEKLWAINVDTKHKLLMRPNDNEIEAMGGKALDKVLLDLAAPYSQEDEAEKHLCIVDVNGKECGKPFKAQIFVQKHVLNKHREWFDARTKDEQHATKYFNNYVREPQRVMPPLASERGGKDANGVQGSSLSARLGGFDYSNGYGQYGSGSLLRMGGPAVAVGHGNGRSGSASMHDRLDDAGHRSAYYERDSQPLASAIDAQAAARRRDPLPSPPKPLDPRANNAPRSYQDLDAGGPAETAELELEY